MKKSLTISAFILILAGCASPMPGETNNRIISPGQWTVPQEVGQNAFLVRGWNTSDAISGATIHCRGIGKRMESSQIVPSEALTRATITYSCK